MAQIACRGIRGATTADNNDRESIIDATKEVKLNSTKVKIAPNIVKNFTEGLLPLLLSSI